MIHTPSRILIVEDELLIAMELEDVVRDLGCTPVGPAQTTAAALAMLANDEIDVAILDIGIEEDVSFSIADELARSGKSWIFTSGYNPDVLRGRYADVPLVQKPFSTRDILAAVKQMLGAQASRNAAGPEHQPPRAA